MISEKETSFLPKYLQPKFTLTFTSLLVFVPNAYSLDWFRPIDSLFFEKCATKPNYSTEIVL